MDKFTIRADQLSWISGAADDPEDLCLHGHVTVEVGERKLEDDGTVSATALCLLRTLTEDKIMGRDIQMIPCCGHFLVANGDLTAVEIIGCDNGTDWSTVHEDGGVRITLATGEAVWVDLPRYRAEVLRFADAVEAYYRSCRPKEPGDEFSRRGYRAFWNEWRRRREEE